MATGLIVLWLAAKLGELGGAWFILSPIAALLAGLPVGLTAGWLVSGDEAAASSGADPPGSSAACGLTLTMAFVGIGMMLLIGPLAGLGGGTMGGLLSADHPRMLRPAAAQTGAEAAPGSPV